MTPSTARPLPVLALLAVLLLTAVGAPAPPRAAVDPQPGAAGHTTADDGRRTALAYWTPERMAAAPPRTRTGPPEADAPPSRTGDRFAPATATTGRRWHRGGRVAATTGRVYLTMNGADFTCSASVIAADNRDTVLTAGHCLKDRTGAWADNWIFVPGYRDGAEPYGRYSARDMLVPPQWSRRGDDDYDFGMAVLDTDRAGRHVADRTGAHPVDFGGRTPGRVYAFGYPSLSPYAGRHLHYCSGATFPDRQGTRASGLRCTMTQGSSGGPWFADFDPATGTGTITSLISFKYSDDSTAQYGPRLGRAAQRLHRAAQSR